MTWQQSGEFFVAVGIATDLYDMEIPSGAASLRRLHTWGNITIDPKVFASNVYPGASPVNILLGIGVAASDSARVAITEANAGEGYWQIWGPLELTAASQSYTELADGSTVLSREYAFDAWWRGAVPVAAGYVLYATWNFVGSGYWGVDMNVYQGTLADFWA